MPEYEAETRSGMSLPHGVVNYHANPRRSGLIGAAATLAAILKSQLQLTSR